MSGNLIGQTLLGKYRIDTFINSGGMGTVYRVWDMERNVPLAMKMLHSELAEDPSILKRFKREANALKKLTHPNIVPFYGLLAVRDNYFLLQHFVDGPTLKDVLKQQGSKPMRPDQMLIYLKAVTAALGYAHASGVVHCDVKPGNVMIDRGGTIYLTDFGIARHSESTTTTLGFAGTADYMAPEQCRGEAVTAQTDIYALGVMLYEMLAGVRPFRGTEAGTDSSGGTAAERIRLAHINQEPPDPRQHNPRLSEELAGVILKALAKAPEDRFRSTRELFDALCAAAGLNPSAVPDRAALSQEILEADGGLPVAQAAPMPPYAVRAGKSGGMGQTPLLPWLPGGTGLVVVAAVVLVVIVLAVLAFGSGGRSALPTPAVAQATEPPRAIDTAEPPTPKPVQPEAPTDVPTPIPLAAVSSSPGGHIVFTCFVDGIDQLCTMNADGSNQQQITFAKGTTWYASYSPDGQTIAFSARQGKEFGLFFSGTDGANTRQIIANSGENYAPEISPDGSQIVFTSKPIGDLVQSIWIMGIDGSNLTQVAWDPAGDSLDPTWSPDGRQLLFASKRGSSMELYAQNVDGSNLRQLTFNMDIGGRSAWSPDGSTIAFYAGPKGGHQIYFIDPDGTNLRPLTRTGDNKAPSFSPDGQWLVYAGSDGDNEIFSVRVDGSQATQLTFNTRADWQPRWGP